METPGIVLRRGNCMTKNNSAEFRGGLLGVVKCRKKKGNESSLCENLPCECIHNFRFACFVSSVIYSSMFVFMYLHKILLHFSMFGASMPGTKMRYFHWNVYYAAGA